MEFLATYLHDSGMHNPRFATIRGDKRDDVHSEAQRRYPGGYYLFNITFAPTSGGDRKRVVVWAEDGGWTEEADKLLPA